VGLKDQKNSPIVVSRLFPNEMVNKAVLAGRKNQKKNNTDQENQRNLI
jgi:hypothetical protein